LRTDIIAAWRAYVADSDSVGSERELNASVNKLWLCKTEVTSVGGLDILIHYAKAYSMFSKSSATKLSLYGYVS